MLTITPITAFDDNYIWLLHNQGEAIVIDPGEASPVLQTLKANSLDLQAILITHYHSDHIGGVEKLQEEFNVKVYAPSYGNYRFSHIPISEGDEIEFAYLGLKFKVLWLPGHTPDHIAYLSGDLLFCGDVLFGAGCGRLFDGSPQQMLHSLNRLKALDPNTRIFCAHEYTSKNIEFALTIEPNNQHLIERQQAISDLREHNKPSIPSTLALELLTNPFLRIQLISNNPIFSTEQSTELSIFTKLRNLRNHF